MEIHTLFPTVLGVTKIKEYESIKEKYAPEIIKSFEQNPLDQAPWANYCNSWQIIAPKNIEQLFYLYFEEHVHKWFTAFGFPPVKYIADMWVNVHTSEMYQETHNHIGKGNILCGNYNLQLNKKDRPVVFTKNNTYENLLTMSGLDVDNPYLTNNSHHLINIEEGDLVLFSPDTEHYAPCATSKHDGHRITLSFNIKVDVRSSPIGDA
ncbi:hypothetical protein [uncultured phage MedDCM-OCT-S05-C429]|nr:hypothetical protein [uncultured phage MedDCM-OCT-S05-C429]